MKQKIKEYNNWAKKIIPSEYKEKPWLAVLNPKYKKTKGTYAGKWCIIASTKKIDKIWKKIFSLVSDGHANSAKVRSGFANPTICFKTNEVVFTNQRPTRVICVYVSDYRKKDAVFKLRDKIRELGVKEDLKFKTDATTRKGIYSGDEREFLYTDSIKQKKS